MKIENEINIPNPDIKNKHSSLLTMTNFICSFLYFVFGIAAFIISIISFKTLNASWSDTSWKHLAPLSLTVPIIIIILSIFGVSTFSIHSHSKPILLTYIITSFLSFCLSLSTGIFASMGARIHHKVDNTLECDSPLTGILQMWNNIAIYLHYADSIHCSSYCQCAMNEDTIASFESSESTKKALATWNYVNEGVNAIKFTFQECPNYAKEEAWLRFIEHIERYSNNNNNWFDENKFAEYWKYIETKFECSGWCMTKYNDPYTLKEKHIYKYVFRNINDGIVKYPGCLNRIVKWVHPMLGSFAGCIMISACLQLITSIFGIIILTTSHNKHNQSFEKGRASILDKI